MRPDEYARLRRLIVISWAISLILGMIILYFGSRELANVKSTVDIQQATLDSNSTRVTKLIERVNELSSDEFRSNLKGEKGDKGDKGDNGINGTNGNDGKNAISNNTIIEKQSIQQVPVKGDKGDKGDQGEKGEDARQIELCRLVNPLLTTDPLSIIGWRYVGTTVCLQVEGVE